MERQDTQSALRQWAQRGRQSQVELLNDWEFQRSFAYLAAGCAGLSAYLARLPLEWWGYTTLMAGTFIVVRWLLRRNQWLSKLMAWLTTAAFVLLAIGLVIWVFVAIRFA